MIKLQTIFWRWWYRHHQEPSKYTKEKALAIAKEYELDAEVMMFPSHYQVSVSCLTTVALSFLRSDITWRLQVIT